VDAYLLDWLNLALRWFHVIVGISWIGTSLYFMWLDAALTPPDPPRADVQGEVWMVHSGGFYRVERHLATPGVLPPNLHWFRWEAAFTWFSGATLLIVVYYATRGVYLVDATSPLGAGAATAVGVAFLVVGWFVYDLLWRSPLAAGRATGATAISFVLLFVACWGMTRLLSGRAAFLHVGAMLGGLMVANVWAHIVPAQKEMIAATREGRQPDLTPGQHAKRRSTHNSYLTFPVVFMMLSNHFPGLYGHRLNWLVLILLIVVGAGVRHFMITLEHRRPAPWVWVPVGAAVLGLIVLTRPDTAVRPAASASSAPPVPFAVARGIVDLRCRSCHAVRPSDVTFPAAPNGVAFDSADGIRSRAEAIKQRTVVLRNMPLANKTGMTDEERELLGRWIDQGARIE
jgi:uncharacterized membrane protein